MYRAMLAAARTEDAAPAVVRAAGFPVRSTRGWSPPSATIEVTAVTTRSRPGITSSPESEGSDAVLGGPRAGGERADHLAGRLDERVDRGRHNDGPVEGTVSRAGGPGARVATPPTSTINRSAEAVRAEGAESNAYRCRSWSRVWPGSPRTPRGGGRPTVVVGRQAPAGRARRPPGPTPISTIRTGRLLFSGLAAFPTKALVRATVTPCTDGPHERQGEGVRSNPCPCRAS